MIFFFRLLLPENTILWKYNRVIVVGKDVIFQSFDIDYTDD